MPALEVVEVVAGSPHITLGQVREYLLEVVGSHAASLAAETSRTHQYNADTNTMKGKITHLRSRSDWACLCTYVCVCLLRCHIYTSG